MVQSGGGRGRAAPVAVKALDRDLCAEPAAAARFAAELASLRRATAQCDNVCKLVGASAVDGRCAPRRAGKWSNNGQIMVK